MTKDQELRVPKLDAEVGKSVEFSDVLLVSDKGKVSVGQPFVEGAKVKAEVLGIGRDKKVVVFKKKRRKGYQVKRGHRQPYTSVKIQSISAK